MLQVTKLLTNCVHGTVAVYDEVQAPVDGPLHFGQFLLLRLPLAVPFTSEPYSLLKEGRGKSFKKVVTTKQDILEPIDYPSFQSLSLDAGGVIAGTFFAFGRAGVSLSVHDGHGPATTSTFD